MKRLKRLRAYISTRVRASVAAGLRSRVFLARENSQNFLTISIDKSKTLC